MYCRYRITNRSIKTLIIILFSNCISLMICFGILTSGNNLTDTENNVLHLQKYRNIENKILDVRPTDGSDNNHKHKTNSSLPTIYAITPTYYRSVQRAELTRLAQTFLNIQNFHWIIVEDGAHQSAIVKDLLQDFSIIPSTHLFAKTPTEHKMADTDPNWLKPRGVLQRNAALNWLRENIDTNTYTGVVYFADDDNTYHIRLFEEMRYTKTVSVWPVGLVGKLLYEAPLCSNGKVTGWRTYWKPERTFGMDMAGFAVNLDLLIQKPEAVFPTRVRRGELESDFLSRVVRPDQLEPKAKNCTEILVWHTRTEKPELKNEDKFKAHGILPLNPHIIV